MQVHRNSVGATAKITCHTAASVSANAPSIIIVVSISNAPFIIDIISPRPATIESISNAPPILIIIDIILPRPATILS
eukprot:Em0011g350a